jgi:hypothetical protein
MRELLPQATAYEKSQGYGEFMAMVGGENERVSLRSSSGMEPYEPQRYTGMKPQALAEWNLRSNTLWIKL